jgi:hypothetical protein
MLTVTRAMSELATHLGGMPPQTGTATVVPGSGVFFDYRALRELIGDPDRVGQLQAVLEALKEAEEYAMAILDEDDTGIENTLWFVPVPGGQHGPRIEVAIDPPNAVRRGGAMATVPFDPTRKAEGVFIAPALEKDVRDFIDQNREVLLRYWNMGYTSTKKFTADLRPLPKRR